MDMQSLFYQSSPSAGTGAAPSCSLLSSSVPIGSTFPTSSNLSAASFPSMQSHPAIFAHSVGLSSTPFLQPPTLAPLRFIIPNPRASNSFGLTASSQSFSRLSVCNIVGEPEHEPLPQYSMTLPRDRCTIETKQQQLFPSGSGMLDESNQPNKMTFKRTRLPKRSIRSTKSKARPGLRKGKWTEEESSYATQLTYYFKEGLLPLKKGTMLRLYLSQKLNCEPMRITKKFTGEECIGKQVFRPCNPTPESRARLLTAQLELVVLKAAFVQRLKDNHEDPPAPMDELDAFSASFDCKFQPVQLKPRLSEDGKDGDGHAVGLLLDFFYKANRNEKQGENSAFELKNDNTIEVNKYGNTCTVKRLSSISTSPTSNCEIDSANSPTKRMRTLSVSGCIDPGATKRSRIGSFSTITAA